MTAGAAATPVGLRCTRPAPGARRPSATTPASVHECDAGRPAGRVPFAPAAVAGARARRRAHADPGRRHGRRHHRRRRPPVAVFDYTGTPALYRVVRRASPLPVVLDNGVVANLDYLRAHCPTSTASPPGGLARAARPGRRAGPAAGGRPARAARVHRGRPRRRSSAARDRPSGCCCCWCARSRRRCSPSAGRPSPLLADARRRLFELAALRVVGVRQRTLRRSAVAEQALLLGAALSPRPAVRVRGGRARAAGGADVLRSRPRWCCATARPSCWRSPARSAFAVLLWATAVVAGRALARAAVPARLRESGR